jgi:hypothetical protein
MYTTAIITFIEILGFKSLIDRGSFDDVSKKLKILRHFSAPNKNPDDEGIEPKVIQFSDSIIRIRPLRQRNFIDTGSYFTN